MANPADLVINNIGPLPITIQTIGISAGASYTVPFANIGAFATDPYLRVYVMTNQCTLTVLGNVLRLNDAVAWLDAIFRQSVVYAS